MTATIYVLPTSVPSTLARRGGLVVNLLYINPLLPSTLFDFSVVDMSGATDSSSGDQPSQLLGLPREIRDEIFSYLVPKPPDTHQRIWLPVPSTPSSSTLDTEMKDSLAVDAAEKIVCKVGSIRGDGTGCHYLMNCEESDIQSDWSIGTPNIYGY